MTNLKTWLQSLLARKIVIAFLVGAAGGFADSLTSYANDGIQLTGTLVLTAIGGAVGAGIRALLALSPVNIVPSDGAHTVTTTRKRRPR